ncbi:MAG: DinB family protein, partial [Terrimonas sp.]|nr:DinB family protein [Terrimonas sp.]
MDDIAFGKAFAKELEAETTATRKCLERIPVNLFEYKPHEKSMPLGYLALLVAEIPKWITVMINDSEIDFMTYPHFKATNTAELVAHFDENISDAKKALLSIKENALKDPFYLKRNGQVVFSASKRAQIESTINHMVHHRGQLTV